MLVRQPVSVGGSGSTYIDGYMDAHFRSGMTQQECLDLTASGEEEGEGGEEEGGGREGGRGGGGGGGGGRGGWGGGWVGGGGGGGDRVVRGVWGVGGGADWRQGVM